MGTNPLTVEEMTELNVSYTDSSELLRGIYQNIKDWKEHEMQANSEAAHRGYEQLKENIEHLLPMRLASFQSPPRVKQRKRAANWRTPPENRSPSRNNRFNGARGANNATRRANNAARNARANTLRRLRAANNAAPGGTLPYNANALG
jgi:hypothetical protein